jgi:polyhydroxyalkanoate synthesis regulator phasin
MTTADAREFLADLISQLFHADVLITEQAERIDALEAEVIQLRAALRNGAAA